MSLNVSLIKSAHAIILYIIVYIFIYFPGLDPDPAASQLGFLRFANFTWCVWNKLRSTFWRLNLCRYAVCEFGAVELRSSGPSAQLPVALPEMQLLCILLALLQSTNELQALSCIAGVITALERNLAMTESWCLRGEESTCGWMAHQGSMVRNTY